MSLRSNCFACGNLYHDDLDDDEIDDDDDDVEEEENDDWIVKPNRAGATN